jgi:hypothetical protein
MICDGACTPKFEIPASTAAGLPFSHKCHNQAFITHACVWTHLTRSSRRRTTVGGGRFQKVLKKEFLSTRLDIFLKNVELVNIGHRQAIHDLYMPAKRFQRRYRLLVPQLIGFLVRHQHEVPGNQCGALFHSILLRSGLVDFTNLHNQAVLHAEYCVRRLIRVTFDVKCPTMD